MQRIQRLDPSFDILLRALFYGVTRVDEPAGQRERFLRVAAPHGMRISRDLELERIRADQFNLSGRAKIQQSEHRFCLDPDA